MESSVIVALLPLIQPNSKHSAAPGHRPDHLSFGHRQPLSRLVRCNPVRRQRATGQRSWCTRPISTWQRGQEGSNHNQFETPPHRPRWRVGWSCRPRGQIVLTFEGHGDCHGGLGWQGKRRERSLNIVSSGPPTPEVTPTGTTHRVHDEDNHPRLPLAAQLSHQFSWSSPGAHHRLQQRPTTPGIIELSTSAPANQRVLENGRSAARTNQTGSEYRLLDGDGFFVNSM